MKVMKYFIDTEFIEGFHKPLFGKKRHHIDLISIGIVAEDGRSYYAVGYEYNPNDADEWVKENVIIPAYIHSVHGDARNKHTAWNFHKTYGKTNEEIASEISKFMGCWRDQHFWRVGNDVPEIYGYYADYDWVLFCSLFGRMIDLPKGFPMYCIDLKQMLDVKASHITQLDLTKVIYQAVNNGNWNMSGEISSSVMDASKFTFEDKVNLIKSQKGYPKQTNEHNALADAKWNFELYKFLFRNEQNAQASVATEADSSTKADK